MLKRKFVVLNAMGMSENQWANHSSQEARKEYQIKVKNKNKNRN